MIIKTKNASLGTYTLTAELKAEEINILFKALRKYDGGAIGLNLASDLTLAIQDNHGLLVKISKE